MNTEYFEDPDDLVAECEHLIEEDVDHAHDRAAIAAFYNGKETMDDCEAEDRGVNELTNHLFGYDSISTASEQVASMVNKAPVIWNVKVTGGKIEVRERWGSAITKHWNRAMVRSGRFHGEWKSLSGELTLFGRSHLIFRDTEDWCPVMRTVYVPRGTKSNENPDYLVIPDDISIRQLEVMLDHAESEDDDAYKIGGIRDAINTLKQDFEPGEDAAGIQTHEDYRPDQAEYDQQEGESPSSRKTSIPVYYVYQARQDEPACPYDLTVVCRYSKSERKKAKELTGDERKTLNPVLFDQEREFESARHFLHNFFIDVNIGGEGTWHRCEGLGHINYDLDVDVEEFFNEAMQGSKENLRSQYQIGNSADREMLERWLAGDGFSNILPEGVTAVENRRNPNFQYAFTAMNMLQQGSKRNANASLSNADIGGKLDELEVQALERQGRNAEAIANRINAIYQNQELLGEEIFRRFLSSTPLPIDDGYDEIMYFQDRMKEEGIPLDFLKAQKNGIFINIDVKVNRVAGDGGSVKEQMVNRTLMANISMFSPGAQKEILHRVTALTSGDFDLADRLVPEDPKPLLAQKVVAMSENDEAHRMGISRLATGQPYNIETNDEDIHLEHVVHHGAALMAYMATGQALGWDEQDAMGFETLVRHALSHVELMKKNEATKIQARSVEQKIQGLVAQSQQFVAQLDQKRQQEQQQQQIDPVEAEKLKQSQENLDLKKHQQLAVEKDREIKNTIAAHKVATSDSRDQARVDQGERKIDLEMRKNIEEAEQAAKEALKGEREPQGQKPKTE